MVTRAVHIESVADLSTESFIAAFQRFSTRRGFPAVMMSDNGTNFVGTKNFLDKNHPTLEIEWKFIPPKSPHHGGVWESAVKAGKKYLLSITKTSIQTEDQFKTTLAMIEAIMNSRPLYQRRIVRNIEDIDVITPGEFLIGSHLLEPNPKGIIPDSLFDLLENQRLIIATFWQKWRSSYLAQLQTRSKWKRSSPNLKIGDIVIIKENSSPCNWPLARIIEGKPDPKGHLRVVTVKSKGSTFKRSVQQLVKLPIESDEEQKLFSSPS